MSLSFPNRSRSFDEARKAVRFLGYDGMFEVAFLVQAEALVPPSRVTAADCLAAFDAARGSIYKAALRAYVRGRSTTLTAADFGQQSACFDDSAGKP
jgi:hypothetical protein